MAETASALFRALKIGVLCILALQATTAGAATSRWLSPGGAPKISGTPPTQVIAGSPYDFRPTASDPNGDKLVFRISKIPRWARFDSATGRLYGTPSVVDVGRIRDIRITVTDGVYVASLPSFTLRVLAGGSPRIGGTPTTSGTEGQPYAFQPTATDPDGQALKFAVMNKPSWASFDVTTGRLAGTPPSGSAGTYASIGISVTDGASTASLAPFAVTVATAPVVNRAPQISGTPPTSVLVGDTYAFTATASDNAPSWLTLDAQTGRLAGVAPVGSVGTYGDIVMSVTDGKEVALLAPFSITVSEPAALAPLPSTPPPSTTSPPNAAPTISGTPGTSVTSGEAYSFTPVASDPDGQTLRFGIANAPSWSTFDIVTGRLSGTPTSTDVGTTSNIVISVSDGSLSAMLPAFSITVTQANRAPTISGTPATSVVSGQAYSFTPTASDPDGQTLTYAISGRPSWATFSTSTGRLSGTPDSTHVGTTSNIVISVSDGALSATLPAFSITVTQANRAPTISGTPATSVTSGQAYSFTPTASDPDGQTLTYAISGRPSWATFSTSTGRLSGTPSASNVGTTSNIVISVSDGSLSATLPAFSITVTQANRAPTISGTPATSVTSGQAYSFTPTASDPDSGQTLRFGIANAPSWSSFDVVTGRLSGTPNNTHVGTTSNIVISVSDGSLNATLPAFSITVADVQTGSATLRWTPPTLNEDGSPITNLSGYRIYYGTNSSNLAMVVELPNPGLTSAVVENLSPATWYFAVKAYNTANVESSLSNIASKTIL